LRRQSKDIHQCFISSVTNFKLPSNRDRLTVQWDDGLESQFAAVWLRDNCPDPKITHPTSYGRLMLMEDLDTDITIKEAATESSGVKVTWPDGHISNYPSQWLRDRASLESNNEDAIDEKILWGADYSPKKHQYDQVLTKENKMLDWLEDLSRYGLTIVENTPLTSRSMKNLNEKIGAAKSTHFGTFWNVVTKSEAMNLAYTSATLGLHLDLPFYSYTPGVQFLQCIKQYSGKGGDNQFTDAFAIAEKIRRDHPKEFKLLCEVDVHFWDAGVLDVDADTEISGKFHKRHSVPTFKLDAEGKVVQVSFNNQVRSSQIFGDVDLTKKMYRALKLFNTLCYDDDFMVSYKLNEGDIAVFDNLRVMHGRKGYTVSSGEDGARRLYGCYIDWDEINDRMNVLKKKKLI